MEKVLRVLNDLERRGFITRYAIGGATAAMFYSEPILTYDLDVFIFLHPPQGKLISLAPLYDHLKSQGYKDKGEHIVIEGVPVQLIPAYNALVAEAVEQAKEVTYKKIKTRVLRLEHLERMKRRPLSKVVQKLFQAKERRRRRLARLSFPEKIRILVEMQKMAGAIRGMAHRKSPSPWKI